MLIPWPNILEYEDWSDSGRAGSAFLFPRCLSWWSLQAGRAFFRGCWCIICWRLLPVLHIKVPQDNLSSIYWHCRCSSSTLEWSWRSLALALWIMLWHAPWLSPGIGGSIWYHLGCCSIAPYCWKFHNTTQKMGSIYSNSYRSPQYSALASSLLLFGRYYLTNSNFELPHWQFDNIQPRTCLFCHFGLHHNIHQFHLQASLATH